MTQLLAGDIGGTKTILRLVKVDKNGATQTQTAKQTLVTLHEDRYASADFTDLVPMVQQFLQEAAAATQTQPDPEVACFAIAGPVVNHTSSLTNLAWFLASDRLQSELGLKQVELINDFEAVGYGILGLQAADIETLQAGDPQAHAPIAIIGAGTGLGQGFLIHQGGYYQVYPSEGGHADFAPRSELEFQLQKYLLDKHSINRVSAERVISGQGIVALYQFLRDRQFASESAEIASIVTTWEREAGKQPKSVDPAAAIAQAAVAQSDPLSQKAMDIFVEAYGAEAGNLALKLLPYGGLYIAGGIAAKNITLMRAGSFMSAFGQKGRVSGLLEKVPVHIVLNPQVGLIGAALKAAQLS
ncbi:glucokinase [Almyronema epifaneia]|uniref:Glucokinase n=1 Tax=Almyronema epifaneia S1 TaxID=2991925 RepID=A0ABW6I9B9_9CYAN